jgi:hypothetical protein
MRNKGWLFHLPQFCPGATGDLALRTRLGREIRANSRAGNSVNAMRLEESTGGKGASPHQ